MKLTRINDKNFSDFLKNLSKPLVIKFYNPECHLCKGIKPLFQNVSTMYDGFYDFAEVNSYESPKLCKFFKIEGVPQLYILDGDQKVIVPYPENPDPDSGYSNYDMLDFLDMYKTNRRG